MKRRSVKPGEGAESLVISVHAKPRSPVSQLQQLPTGNWVARLVSPPVDGKANAELIALVASHFGCAKSAVTVLSGASGRIKLVRVEGVRGAFPHSTARAPRARHERP